ncbi:MAG TPA: caspase family protein [Gemmatimonadota bacterium]|nr:caspase family protein [Gemmatimonadota bacterium]
MNPRRVTAQVAFVLVASLCSANASAQQPTSADEAGPIYGVFIGISDYPGEDMDLAYTASDARRVHDALVRAGMSAADAVILTDADATVEGVEAAFRTLAAGMDPNGTFVFFFSGHGEHVGGSAEADGMDEAIVLHDGSLTDDQLNALFGELNARISLVVIDASFSGGFARDVISTPGRMGFFSSEEDMVSSVASEFRAGGYLSVFMADAVGDGLADEDGDGSITALELSQYLHERYRATGMSEEQRLVIDRGSVGPYDVLFRLPQ